MMDPKARTSLIAEMRSYIHYTAEVAKWEGLFFELVGVQLKDGLWALDPRVGKKPILEDRKTAEGEVVGFTFVVPVCVIQPSPIPDMLRLTVPQEDATKTSICIDIPPSQILYVTSVVPSVADREHQGGGSAGGSRIVAPSGMGVQ